MKIDTAWSYTYFVTNAIKAGDLKKVPNMFAVKFYSNLGFFDVKSK